MKIWVSILLKTVWVQITVFALFSLITFITFYFLVLPARFIFLPGTKLEVDDRSLNVNCIIWQ